jgi:hypothetical protein
MFIAEEETSNIIPEATKDEKSEENSQVPTGKNLFNFFVYEFKKSKNSGL